jgi:eukaryotic-like serine/threonine-protein kinase
MAERSPPLNFSAISADEAKVVAATSPSTRPERFGRYVLLDRIGSGGMAEVFRAVMPGAQGFRQTFVVKRILAERSRAADFVEMFVQEARIGSMLSHPNIVQVFDFGNVGGDYFLAMEYLRGRDVQALMRRLRQESQLCPVPVATFIAHEVAVCLGYAHDLIGPDKKRLNIVHRDVSPSNIMCLRTGGVKLLDFGIAKAGDQTENTEQGLFKGKLAYVAPERIKNEALDGRVDLFGLGVVLWEMLAGRRLFRGKSELETLNNVLEMPVPPPSTHRTDVPASLDRVVMRALERDRNARYPTGQAMADDLEIVLRETGYHSRMLGTLLREVFGSDLSKSQESLSSVTQEMLATLTGDDDGTATGTLRDSSGDGRPQWSWQRGFSLVAAAAVTATLAGLLLGRGGGGNSYARERVEPATGAGPIVPTVDPLPPAVNARPAPRAAAEPPAGSPPVEAAPDVTARDTGKHRSKRAHRGHGSRKQVEEDRVMRGLSIDPFAEAQRTAKP